MSLNDTEDLYNKNTSLLKKKYPAFGTDILKKFRPSTDMILSETAGGLPAARIDNIWIHSSREPVKEAERLVQSGITSGNGICLVYGFGLGYHIEAVRKEFPDLDVIVIEPEPELFLKALECRDFSGLFASEKISLLLAVGTEFLPSVLGRYRTMKIQTIKLRSVQQRNSAYYEAADKQIRTFIRKKETNMNTLNRFGRTWTRNLFRNIEVFLHARDCGLLYGRFRGFPAIVIAAGPSLDKLLPFMSELQKKFILICVDTAVGAVCSCGVAPDFIVVVDPQYLNTRHLDNLLNREPAAGHSLMLSESSAHPAVFRNSMTPVFFYRSFFPLGKIIERTAGISTELGAGGSVATTAWDFARRLGCSEIYAAGLDLGYPDQNTHCRTSLSALYTMISSDRFTPAETINFRNVRSAAPYPVINNAGTETLTDRRLEIYKWWFEGQIEASGGFPFYNLSEKGIKIGGMRPADINGLLLRPDIRNEIAPLLSVFFGSANGRGNDSLKDLSDVIEKIVAECRRLESVCGEALELLEKICRLNNEETVREYLNRLNQLDSAISNSPTKELSEFIIQPVLNEIIDEDGTMIENSRNLYSSIKGACEYNRLHAERALKRFS